MGNLQLDSQSKLGENFVIQVLTKDLNIIKITSEELSNSKQLVPFEKRVYFGKIRMSNLIN